MYILFSPSEKKIHPIEKSSEPLKFLFSQKPYKIKPLESYVETLKNGDERAISSIFGKKQINIDDLVLSQNIYDAPRTIAISLYDGVAYKALDFEIIKNKDFIYKNLLIFSNLFGAIKSNDKIPFYSLHQGKGILDFNLNHIYEQGQNDLDSLLGENEILDLRAEIYIKAYKPKAPHTKIDFLKDGKKVSHYAKYYRGIYLRYLAEQNIECMDKLEKASFPNLKLTDKSQKQNVSTLTYEIH